MATITKRALAFDAYGAFTGTLPPRCVSECTAPGHDASEAVAYWRKRLGFTVPRAQAIAYLQEFGAWQLDSNEYDTGLNQMSDEELADKVLWIACGDMKERGEVRS